MNAGSIEQLVQQGISATRAGNHTQALELLREAVQRAPDNEQAWLWLSGVEASDQAKIAALNNVLRINPANAAAQRGINLLTKPKDLDFASIVAGATAPPPAKAATIPTPRYTPPAPVQPVQPPAPVATPPAVQASQPLVAEVPSVPLAELAADLPASEPEHISSDVVNELKPAIEKAGKRRILPSRTEWIIMGVLLLLLFGAFRFITSQFAGQFNQSDQDQPVNEANVPPSNNAQPTQAPNAQPTQVPNAQPTQPPANSAIGSLYKSRAYNLQVSSFQIDPNNSTVSVSVVLNNPTTKQAVVRTSDFSLISGGAALVLNKGQSTVFDTQGRASIAPNGSINGMLVWTGKVAEKNTTLKWQPANGGANISIPLQ